MRGAEELAEAISLGVRERRLRRAGYSEQEIAAPPMPLSAHTDDDQRNWLDTAEAVIEVYGAPPAREEGMTMGPDPDPRGLWQAIAILGALCAICSMLASIVLVLTAHWTKAVYFVAFAVWLQVTAQSLWRASR